MATPNIVPRADSEGQLGTSSKYWGAAYIDLIYVGAGKIGRDADNLFDFSTDNQLKVRIGGVDKLMINGSRFAPNVNDGMILGSASLSWSDLFLASGAVINFADGDIALTHSSNVLEFTGGLMRFVDSQKLTFGSSNDLEIYHDTSNSYIVAKGTGDLIIQQTTDDKDIIFQSDDGSGGVETYFFLDGSLSSGSPFTTFPDQSRAGFGTNNDLTIYHDGSNTYMYNNGGDLKIMQAAADKDLILMCDDGSGGETAYITLDGGAVRTISSQHISMNDGKALYVGDGLDAGFYHSGGNNFLEINSGDFKITQNANDKDIIFNCDDGAGGVATYFYLDGSSATHNGSATTGLYTNWPDYSRISMGTSHDLQIYHDSANSNIINAVGNLAIQNNADDGDIKFFCDDGSGGVTAYLTLDGGYSTPQVIIPDNAALVVGTGLDFSIIHNGSNTALTNNTGDLTITNNQDDGDIEFKTDDGSGGVTTYFRVDGTQHTIDVFKQTHFYDNVKTTFGSGNDLQIFHDATDSYINNYTGDLKIRNLADDKDIVFQSDDGSGGTTAYLTLDGSAGYTIASQHILYSDNVKALFGTAGDLKIYHDGTDSVVQNDTGDLEFQNRQDDGDIVFKSDDGSGGVAEYFRLDGGAVETYFSKSILHFDNVKAKFGDGSDLQIYHDTTNSFIENYTGDLKIVNYADDKDIIFFGDDGGGNTITALTLDMSAAGTAVFNHDVKVNDNGLFAVGDSYDARFYHDGSNTYLRNETGNLTITNLVDDGDIIFQSDDGSGGVETYFFLDGSENLARFLVNTRWNDGEKIQLGTGGDLQIVHDGTDSTITNTTGNLNFYQNTDDGDIRFYNDNGSGGTTEYFRLDGGDSSTQIKTIKVLMPNLPTSDPSVAGQLWNSSGDLKISAG